MVCLLNYSKIRTEVSSGFLYKILTLRTLRYNTVEFYSLAQEIVSFWDELPRREVIDLKEQSMSLKKVLFTPSVKDLWALMKTLK